MKIVRFFLFFAIIVILIVAFVDISKASNSTAESKRNGEYTPSEGYDISGGWKLNDTTIRAVWREDVYDQKMKENVNVIMLNYDYFGSLSQPERAVFAYLASTIGNECYNEGAGVVCKLLTALDMGTQCSEQNKKFLSAWFANEPEIIKQVENCKPTLPGTTTERTFDAVKVSTSGSTIKVNIKGLILNIKESSVSKWSENITFKIEGDNLKVAERTKKD